jgi:hypothetical protein
MVDTIRATNYESPNGFTFEAPISSGTLARSQFIQDKCRHISFCFGGWFMTFLTLVRNLGFLEENDERRFCFRFEKVEIQ